METKETWLDDTNGAGGGREKEGLEVLPYPLERVVGLSFSRNKHLKYSIPFLSFIMAVVFLLLSGAR